MNSNVLHIFLAVLLPVPVSAQIPVREEPRHKVALQNEYVRLLDVRIPPGDTSLFHIHQIPSYFIPLSTTAIGAEVEGHSPTRSRFPLDSTWYNGFDNGPLIHRVWNDDTNVLHVIDLELLSLKNSTLPAGNLLPFNIGFENDKLRVYKFELSTQHKLTLPSLKTPMLLISEIGAEVEIKELDKKGVVYAIRPGGFQWLDAQRNFQINNLGNIGTRCILILLK